MGASAAIADLTLPSAHCSQVATPAQRWLCTTPPPSVMAAVLGRRAASELSSSELARCLCEALVLGTAAEEA